MAVTDFTAAIIENTAAIIENLRLEQARLRQGLVARNTVLGYGYDVRSFAAWCERFHRAALPCSPETLGLYLTDLLDQGKKITTVDRRKCAIAYEHRSSGLPCPVTDEIRELLRGAQRLRGEKPRQMRPITVHELCRMSGRLARLATPAALRDRALLVLGFATALRRSNLAALNLADVEFCRQGMIVSVDREKQDQDGHGRLIGVVRGKHPNTCPVRVLRAWLRVRGSQAGPLFPRLDRAHQGQPMDGECVCRIVKASVSGIGLDPAEYGAHSLRAGMVTAAGEADVGVLRISRYTGQSPAIVERYFRRTNLFRASACAALGL
jgi:site-specific recombinase XerD